MFLYSLLYLLLNSIDYANSSLNPLAGNISLCSLPRKSPICNPDHILSDVDVERLEKIDAIDKISCRNSSRIGFIITNSPHRDYQTHGYKLRSQDGESALMHWYPECPLNIFYVIWLYSDKQIKCSGFRRLEAPVDPSELNELCKQAMNKTKNIGDLIENVIYSTRNFVFSKENHIVNGNKTRKPEASGHLIFFVVLLVFLALAAIGLALATKYISYRNKRTRKPGVIKERKTTSDSQEMTMEELPSLIFEVNPRISRFPNKKARLSTIHEVASFDQEPSHTSLDTVANEYHKHRDTSHLPPWKEKVTFDLYSKDDVS